MAKISTYNFATPPTLGSYVIGTLDVNSKDTKNFRISDILALSGEGLFVPYTGATEDVDLGNNSITASSFIKLLGLSSQFLKADGSIDDNVYITADLLSEYVPYTGATEDVDLLSHSITASSFIKLSGLPSQFLKADGSVDSNSYLTSLAASSTYVPYTGALSNISLGLKSLSGFDITASNSLNANGPFKVSGNAGLAGQILVSVGPAGAPVWQNHDDTFNRGLYAQTADGGPVTATTVETTIIGPGVGTLTVPANSFKIGNSFQASLDGIISCVGTATIHVRVKTLTGVLLADTGIIALEAATSKSWLLNLYFTIRTLGVTGTASVSSGGLFSYIKNSGTNFEGYVLNTINNTTFDTTVNNTLDVTIEWNTANAGNSILSRNFTLNKTY